MRRAVTTGDRDRARGLRIELRHAERAWDEALARLEADAPEESEAVGGPACSLEPEQPAAPRGPGLAGAVRQRAVRQGAVR